jgi:hypothetical protein
MVHTAQPAGGVWDAPHQTGMEAGVYVDTTRPSARRGHNLPEHLSCLSHLLG